MHKYIFFFTIVVVSGKGFSQSVIPEYGTIVPEEIKMKQCAFDKEADAVILLDKAVSNYDDDKQLITKRRIKFKILKESGIGRGDVRISFYSEDEFEKIEDLEAYVLNENETGGIYKTIFDKKSIFTNKVNKLYSEIKMAMPEVKVGSIIEYQYTSIKKSFYGIRDWNFQIDIPTLISQYDLTILPGASFAYKIVKSKFLPIEMKNFKDDGRIIFEMKNIAGLRTEPFMDAADDYRQQIVFQLAEYRTYYGTREKVANTWAELAQELLRNEDFGKAIEKNIKGADELITRVNALPDEHTKMTTIYSFVRKNFEWDHIYSYYANEGLKKIWDKKRGNAADINLLLINLLKEVKLEVYPILISERDHGRVDGSYPFIGQFSKVAALVVINGKRHILDATDPTAPIDMIPFDLLNTNAFIVAKKSSGVILLEDDSRTMKNFTGIQGEIDEEGIVNGRFSKISYDYSRHERLLYFRKHNKEKFISNYFQKDISNIKIDSIEINNESNDSVGLEQKFHFTVEMPASGEYRMVNLNLFGEMDKSPFVSDNRFTNINFGSQLLNTTTQVLQIPASMKPDVIPKNINLVMPDNSISLSRVVAYEEATNTFTIRFKWQIKKTVFTPEEYPSIKDFYKKMVEILNEPLVLKKK